MMRPGSAQRFSSASPSSSQSVSIRKPKMPELEDFLVKSDFSGAIALLLFEINAKIDRPDQKLWLAYCYFHYGEYDKAANIYEKLIDDSEFSGSHGYPSIQVLLACCYYGLGDYERAERQMRGEKTNLSIRIAMHIAHKLKKTGDEALAEESLKEVSKEEISDSLSLAALSYLKSDFSSALQSYRKVLADFPNLHAIFYYIALCHYQLEAFEECLVFVGRYLEICPQSITARNLKACALFNTKGPSEARAALPPGTRGILPLNNAVFNESTTNGHIFKSFVMNEAKANYALWQLRNDEGIPKLSGNSKIDRFVSAASSALTGQKDKDPRMISQAQGIFFALAKEYPETLFGRESLASALFLEKKFPESIAVLDSFGPYGENSAAFLWNRGMAAAAVEDWKGVISAFENFVSPDDQTLISSWLCKAWIRTERADRAWNFFEKSNENVLHLIASECFIFGAFYISAKAYGALGEREGFTNHWEGLRSAACGCFQLVIAGKEKVESLGDICNILKSTKNAQADYIVDHVFRPWLNGTR